MSTSKQKPLMRIAMDIREELASTECAAEGTELPTAYWQESSDLLRRIRLARQRGWYSAAQRLKRDLQGAVQRLQMAFSDIQRKLEPRFAVTQRASSRDIYADLAALHDEFDEVSLDRHKRTISVTTEPITLEDVYLGPFEIRLDWDGLAEGGSDNYRVIALDEQPAACNESVTHPHVQDEAVCEGEGRQPIRHALEQGRLLDFFVIVANLLRTYNGGSPYVSLSEWHGRRCTDCGGTASEDECWTCDKCETTLCGDCYVNCPGCERVYCSECVTRCEGCDQDHCRSCMKHCSTCGAELCRGCLDEKERCLDCHDEETKKEGEEAGPCEASGDWERASVAFQPHGVGETAVPA